MFQSTSSENNQIYFSLTLLFLASYAILTAFLEHKNFPLHRCAVSIIIGFIAGGIIRNICKARFDILAQFSDQIIFTVLFPPIIFTSGFTISRHSILRVGRFVSLFGILGTILSFLVICSLLLGVSQLGIIRDAGNIQVVRSLKTCQLLLLSSCLCSIDTIASEETVKEHEHPRLHCIIFGQCIMADTISIVLFRAISNLDELKSKQFVFYTKTAFEILLIFLYTIIGSIIIGIAVASFLTWIFKKWRFLHFDQGITQTSVLFLIGFLVYIVTQIAQLSGVISILFYGITLKQYNQYNMSQIGHITSKNTFHVIANISQGYLFLLMGMMFWQGQWTKDSSEKYITHSWTLCIALIMILIISRAINILMLTFIFRKLCVKINLQKQELYVLFWSGLVRGATPFALFTSLQSQDQPYYKDDQGVLLKSTIIIIIFIGSVFLNSIIPRIYKSSLLSLKQKKQKQLEVILIPQGLTRRYHKFEQRYIRPLLIYNYQKRKQEIDQQMDSVKNNLSQQDTSINRKFISS